MKKLAEKEFGKKLYDIFIEALGELKFEKIKKKLLKKLKTKDI